MCAYNVLSCALCRRAHIVTPHASNILLYLRGGMEGVIHVRDRYWYSCRVHKLKEILLRLVG
eukprot:3081748-Pyramimonas_sp.AAC.1